jgi:hypothetical protein
MKIQAGYEILIGLKNNIDTAEALYHLILTILDSDLKNKMLLAEDYLKELKHISIQTQNDRVQIFHKIALGYFYKKQGRSI